MRTLITVAVLLFLVPAGYSQKTKVPPKKYPSLLWEITGKGMSKPSYLFGTMHVSSKMAFHLSDSFYIGIKNADVVALETDMGNWQEDFSKYDLEGANGYNIFSGYSKYLSEPKDYLTISTLQFPSYEKMIEMALYNNPSIINNFLYRSYSEKASDFEEDTYLDLHIYQAGRKWGKKVCGVENFHESMELMKAAYLDAAKEKDKKEKSYDYDGDFSYGKLEDAYRTGNLDLLDTINKLNSTSAAFDEKFLYKRNEIQANSIDSILKTKSKLFVGVGAAHLPGQRGVIEMLREKGYKLRPIKMTERDSRHKDEVEKIRVPVQFHKQTSKDGFYSVGMPGKLYDFSATYGLAQQQQFADMTNGSYYMVTRINTNGVIWGHNEDVVLRKIDSVIYENIPGKILTKQNIIKNGYKGIEVINRTRRGDVQRYNIFVTPFEIVLFKMSGNGEYVKEGKEADQFFKSIEFREYNSNWQKWSPSFGGFEVEFPHQPLISHEGNWYFMARDKQSNTGFELIRTDVHNYDFVEVDSFDLNLMEESFGSSDFIDKQISRKQTKHGIYPALETKYRYKDGSVAHVKFIIQGTHYYTLVAHSKSENPGMTRYLNSFNISPFVYGAPFKQTDTSLYYTVTTPFPLEKSRKLSMYPEGLSKYIDEEEDLSEEVMDVKQKIIANDSTGEKIYVSFHKPSRYYYDSDTSSNTDTTIKYKGYKQEWTYRFKKVTELPDKMKMTEAIAGDPKSSRYIRIKRFIKDGVTYRLVTQGDTLSKPSAFINEFFNSFTPSDTVRGVDAGIKKTGFFFSDFFSKDTLLHKRAVKNVRILEFDSTDLPQLKKAIQSLTWKEKKYMDVKKDFIWSLLSIPTNQSADYLKQIYYAAGDTIELQYLALEVLLKQETAYSYQVFRDIMVNEPPVLDMSYKTSYPEFNSVVNYDRTVAPDYAEDNQIYNNYRSGAFLNVLTDSLLLTKKIFGDLLPLINIHDYEQPVMDLLGVLVDSNMIDAKDYEMYQPKFLLEAKQLMKKQVILEKNKLIEKAQADGTEKNIYTVVKTEDYGNSQLSLYAKLLMPFWDKNTAVKQLISQLLVSNDKKLKYNSMMMLLRHNKPLPDTMLSYFASLDDYRYDLYSDLKKIKLLKLFPSRYYNHIDLAKSKLMNSGSSYEKPDSVIYLDRLPVQYKERSGYVYFFKYRKKKDDSDWYLSSIGIISSDPKQFEFEKKPRYFEEEKYDFTEFKGEKIDEDELLKPQLQKALKKLEYSKRNSAAEFYSEEGKSKMDFLRGLNFKD